MKKLAPNSGSTWWLIYGLKSFKYNESLQLVSLNHCWYIGNNSLIHGIESSRFSPLLLHFALINGLVSCSLHVDVTNNDQKEELLSRGETEVQTFLQPLVCGVKLFSLSSSPFLIVCIFELSWIWDCLFSFRKSFWLFWKL